MSRRNACAAVSILLLCVPSAQAASQARPRQLVPGSAQAGPGTPYTRGARPAPGRRPAQDESVWDDTLDLEEAAADAAKHPERQPHPAPSAPRQPRGPGHWDDTLPLAEAAADGELDRTGTLRVWFRKSLAFGYALTPMCLLVSLFLPPGNAKLAVQATGVLGVGVPTFVHAGNRDLGGAFLGAFGLVLSAGGGMFLGKKLGDATTEGKPVGYTSSYGMVGFMIGYFAWAIADVSYFAYSSHRPPPYARLRLVPLWSGWHAQADGAALMLATRF